MGPSWSLNRALTERESSCPSACEASGRQHVCFLSPTVVSLVPLSAAIYVSSSSACEALRRQHVLKLKASYTSSLRPHTLVPSACEALRRQHVLNERIASACSDLSRYRYPMRYLKKKNNKLKKSKKKMRLLRGEIAEMVQVRVSLNRSFKKPLNSLHRALNRALICGSTGARGPRQP